MAPRLHTPPWWIMPSAHAAPWWRALARFVAVGCVYACTTAQGAIVCDAPDAWGARACKASVPETLVRHMAVVQQQSNWCWAAAMEMVLARYGLRMPQQRIVEAR